MDKAKKEKLMVQGSIAVIALASLLIIVFLAKAPTFWLVLAKPTGIGALYVKAGNAAWAKEKKDDALGYYLAAMNRGCESGSMYLGLGRAFEGIQNVNLASKYYEKATQASPDDPDALSNWARVYVQSHRDPETLNRAIEAMKKAVARRPKDLKMRYDLAFLHMQAGDLASARSQAQEILAHDPNHPEARQLLARLDQMGPQPGGPAANPFAGPPGQPPAH